MDELVGEPRIFAAVEGLDGPVDELPDPRYFLCVRMIGKPDIKLELVSNIERYQRVAKRRHIGWQPPYAGALRDRPEMRGADIVAHRDEADLLAMRVFVVELLAFGLVGILKANSMVLADVVLAFRHPASSPIGPSDQGHDVQPTTPYSFHI